jgi:hypothetical protein
VKIGYVTPVVVFSAYLLYGLVRPWISQSWRKGIEVDSEGDDDDDDDEEEPPQAGAKP